MDEKDSDLRDEFLKDIAERLKGTGYTSPYSVEYGDPWERPEDWVSDEVHIFSDVQTYRADPSYHGVSSDSKPHISDYEIVPKSKCHILKESCVQKLHLSPECDCYGNDPFPDDTIYHSYYIVFNNPSK